MLLTLSLKKNDNEKPKFSTDSMLLAPSGRWLQNQDHLKKRLANEALYKANEHA